MIKEEREKARRKLDQARDNCNWVIKNGYGGLKADLPYSEDDINMLREAKKNIMSIHKKLLAPYPPPVPEHSYTKYPLFGEGAIDFMSGYVPWDVHALNIPFHENFTREDWSAGAELLCKYGVNAVRFFVACGEQSGDINKYVLPFKKIGNNKVNLFDYNHPDMEEYEWRLNEFWKRGIATVLCLCTGIKGSRFEHTVWHGKNNNGYNGNALTTNVDAFMTDKWSKLAVRKVAINLYKRWKQHPVIFETINEPQRFGNIENYNWQRYIIKGLKSNGCPMKKVGFEFWDSGKVEDLLKEFGCWAWQHGVNNIDWFRRFHKPGVEMQKFYFIPFEYVASDADGWLNDSWCPNYDFDGLGLVGWKWNHKFKKPCPTHMRDGLIYDYNHFGGGWIIWSAGAWYNKNDTGKPNYKDWYHVAIDGLTKEECKKWDVDWNHFSHIPKGTSKRVPLGELVAVKIVMERIYK